MPALRHAVVTASYQMLGSTTPKETMENSFSNGFYNGIIEKGDVLDCQPLGGNDFFLVNFRVEVPLDGNQSIEDLFRDAKAITDELVGDTDTVISEVQFTE